MQNCFWKRLLCPTDRSYLKITSAENVLTIILCSLHFKSFKRLLGLNGCKIGKQSVTFFSCVIRPAGLLYLCFASTSAQLSGKAQSEKHSWVFRKSRNFHILKMAMSPIKRLPPEVLKEVKCCNIFFVKRTIKKAGYSHSIHNTHTKVLKKLGWGDLGRAALVCEAWREVGGIIDCSFVIKDETPAM